MSSAPLPPQPMPPQAPAPPRRWAMPARLHVVVFFMLQFIAFLTIFGIVVPTLHEQGLGTVLLTVGGVAAIVAVLLVLGWIGRLPPVRCGECGSVARYLGVGWWPFTYRYTCGGCGATRRLEVRG